MNQKYRDQDIYLYMARLVSASVIILTFTASTAVAQGPVARPRLTAVATRVAKPPVIDGNIADEAWQQATPLTNFVQSEPFEGQPATEQTEVRILFDDLYIYVAVNAFDSDPSGINVTDAKRDASMSEQDSFQVIFDTF